MINNYEIKYENNEEILCLYLDFDYEFAHFNFNGKTQEFKKLVKNYIKQNKIKFKGKKVAIVIGGVVMATLLINNPIIANKAINSPTIVEKENIIEENKKEETSIKEEKNEIIDEIEKEEVKVEQNNNQKVEYKDEIKIEESSNKTESNKEIIKNEQSDNQNIGNKTEAKEEIKENVEQKTYVTIYRTNGTILTIELEEYIIGVVAAEMPASFNEEALKAQAIIARTYALKAIENNKVLTDNSSTQNYKDNSQLKSMWGSSYNTYYNKIKNAVEKTKGIYLTYNNQIIEAVYHSTSNGQTEEAVNVWGNSFDYLVSVESPYDSTNPSFEKEKFLTYEQLSSILQTTVTKDTTFSISGYTNGQRVQNIEINDNTYTGVKFRSLLGLRSTDFEIKKEDKGVTITTKGYGHGVGLSQYGANGMAKAGYTYEQILKHYYQGISIKYM